MAYELYAMSVTATTSSQAFSTDKDEIRIRNESPYYLVYFNIDAAATTNHYYLEPGEQKTIRLRGMGAIHAICDTSQTATLVVEGLVG